MLWIDLTWPEIADAARQRLLVVQPCGSLEQHGKHLPVDTDAGIVFEVAGRAAQRAGNTLVLPCLPYGISPHHIDFPGTISLALESYIAVIRDLVRSVAYHGFKTMILLNGHGGNAAALKAVAGAHTHESGMTVMAVTYWDLIDPEDVGKIRTSALGGMSHSGEFETSIQLALRPDRVKTDHLVAHPRRSSLPHTKRDMFAEGSMVVSGNFKAATETGVLGDPTSATPEKGRAFLDLAVDALSDLLQQIWQRQGRSHASAGAPANR
jgi:creatinine amidohydrolase